MANFLPFKDDFKNNNSFAPARTRRATTGIVSNFLSRSGNYKRSGCSLARSASAPQATRVPFLRLNSYGAEETDCPHYCFSQQQQQKLHKTGFTPKPHLATTTDFSGNMDRSDTSTIFQVVDGIRECCSNFIKRDFNKPLQNNSFCAVVRTNLRGNCDSNFDFNKTLPQQETEMPACVLAASLSSCQAASGHQANGYLNDYGTDMDVNNQLIIDLIGDCISPLLHHDVTQPAEKRATDETRSCSTLNVSLPNDSNTESRFCSRSSASALPVDASIPTVSLNGVECVSEELFLTHTMQQRINKESRKAARKRKRNRQAKSSLSCAEVDDTVKQLFDDCTTSFLSTSPVFSGLQSLCASPSVASSVSFSLSDDGEEEEEDGDSDSDDDDWQVMFSDSFGVISLNSCSGISRLRPTLYQYGSPDSNSSDSSDKLSGDHEDEVLSVREEVQRANTRWKECYGSFGSNTFDDWLSIDDSDERYPVVGIQIDRIVDCRIMLLF